MSLLNDDIKALFGDVFGQIYGHGLLTRVTMTNAGGGRNQSVTTTTPVKVQVDLCTEAMQRQDGYTNSDVRLLILQAGLTTKITTNDLVYVNDRDETYKVATVSQDPGESYFECRGVLQKRT